MHTICFNPDVSLRSRPPLSLPFNQAPYLFDEMLERNPLLFSSRKCCYSCCCCYSAANISMCNRLTAISPSFLCKGLSQSTLIQWSINKRLIFHGSSRGFYADTSGSGVSSFTGRNNNHEKLSSFNERRKHRQRGSGHKRKKLFLGNVSDDCVNDVEVMLRLLTDEVGLEYSDARDSKKIDKKHYICDNKEMNNAESGVVKKDLRCDKKQGKILEKKDNVKGYYGESVGVSQDWRKKSEKKLIEEISQPQSNEVDRVTDQSGISMKCKQFEELSDKDNSVIDSTSSSQKLKVISEVKKLQKFDLSGKSSLSESRMKKFEENPTEVSDTVKVINEGKQQKTDHLNKITTVSSERSKQISRISDTHLSNSDNPSDSPEIFDIRMEKHKLYPETSSSEAKVTSTEHDRSSSEMKMAERTTNDGSNHSSHGSGPKGPSDEMWHVTDASDNTSTSSEIGDAIKNSDRSLLTIIGDVIRFRWSSPCSESHIPNSGGGKCSSCLSVSSEAWCSSHEPDDSNNDSIACNPESAIPLPAIKKTSHVSLRDSKNIELERRKLKDNFDEWEEVYTVEAKQRKEDEMFMREALLEAKKAADVWEVPVGAVLVHSGKIISRGYNLVEELHDSTAHAEMICIRQASTKLRSWRLLDTTLYVTLEPCPMCAGAILQARIGTVVWGAPNKLLGADGSWIRLLSDGDEAKDDMPTDKPPAPMHPFHQNMVVRRGVLAAECAGIMKHFFRLRRKKKSAPESLIPSETESPIPPSSLTVSHHHSNFLSKMQHAFKIIFCL